LQQYRATCRAQDCDWTREGTRAEVDAAATRHGADHQTAKRWRARCTWDGCDWSTTGAEQWVRGADKRHKAEHRAERDERDVRRAARYQWRGTPNPTQRRLLEQVRAGALGAYRCSVHVPTGATFDVWYPTNVSARDGLWWPALEQAGLVVARPMWAGGPVPRGVWQLTAAGRRVLEGGAA
jgi:hypothetical protein